MNKYILFKRLLAIRAILKNQVVRTPEVVKQVVEDKLPMSERQRFFAELYNVVNLLLDSRRFNKECADLGYIPWDVALSVVLSGKRMIDKVLQNGLYATFGKQLIIMDRVIFSEKDIQSYIKGEYSCFTDESRKNGYISKEDFVTGALANQGIPEPSPVPQTIENSQE